MIRAGSGNLLEADVDALVNTVNTVGVAGKGIALQFRQAFPANFKAYAAACKRREVQPGRMFVFDTGQMSSPRFIINFPTKRHWRGKSRLADIRAGLDDLVRVLREYEIRSVAIPPLGCGNGGLDWADVEPLIVEAMQQVSGVDVLLFAPDGAPANDEMPVTTRRPELTAQRAAMISLFRRYLIPDYRLTALEAQKLAYFLQVLGQPMLLRFEKAHFGPYAENLNHALQALEGHYTRGYGDRNTAVALHLMPGAAEEADAYLEREIETKQRVDLAANLVRGFETPYGLELLSTVHWAATDLRSGDLNAVTNYVRSWTQRKGELFTYKHVARALERLAEYDLVPA
jgi:O-acetyl-ADP-ribose deacetylase (regulator of RNase III)